jgi:hypothetical protein
MWNFGSASKSLPQHQKSSTDDIVKFSDKVLSVSNLVLVDTTTAISFVGCGSKEWAKIGKTLAVLPRLITLIAENCDLADGLCIGV